MKKIRLWCTYVLLAILAMSPGIALFFFAVIKAANATSNEAGASFAGLAGVAIGVMIFCGMLGMSFIDPWHDRRMKALETSRPAD